MEKYIALLRGVNVGGKNKLPMPLLKASFEKNGFSEVRTYINSGNVIFSCGGQDEPALQNMCQKIIFDSFHLNIAVAVISAKNLSDALCHAPAWWGSDCEAKHNAIFVIAPASVASVITSVGLAKPEYERVDYYGSVIFWFAPIETFSRTRWSKVVATAAYNDITIRNANTAKKLLQLAGVEYEPINL